MTMHERTQNPRAAPGVSIVETLVVIAVMTILLLIVNQIYIINYDLVLKQTGRTDNETGAILGTRLTSELSRGAVAVVASRTVNGTAYVTGANVLILKLPSLTSSDDIVSGSFDYVAFARDATATTKIFADVERAAGSDRPNGKRLVTAYNRYLAFRYNDPDVTLSDRVSVYMVNQQTVRSVIVTSKAWTSLFMRNFTP